MSRVLYLSQWFPPEPNTVGLQVAHGLQARGHEVEVLTGFPNYPTGKLAEGYRLAWHRREVVEGVVVHRVWLHPSHDRSSVGRALNYLSFFLSALVFLLFQARRFDVIYVYHPPLTPALAAAISGWFTRRPFIVEVQDLWPDSVATADMAGTGAIARVLGPLCRFVYRSAAGVLGQSDGMTARLIERGAAAHKTGTVFNWADEDAARAAGRRRTDDLGFEGRFNLVFAGNLGVVQALDALIEAAREAARQEPRIRLTLIGDGTEKARLEALAARSDGVVQVRDAVPQREIGDVLAAADVLVVHLKDDPLFEITLPSKLQFYLAMGRPVLTAVGGEAARITAGTGAGIAVAPGDVPALARAMVDLSRRPAAELAAMGAAGRRAYDARFSFAEGIDRRAQAIARVVARAAA
ncbi:MAG TPA: glycosyltransferase family 4 protein [Brevundimonas sp.]|jgi:glycosyltransferase involved in cell wall biosynthesis|uniref:glycosyltransferase family 4 protein n=1 Tax=Brevundimonas sp. TaxID=1871086 RepID=UPI002DF56B88|nr:glycosyltransferase family 4 protein [Brevundimonas sp.]